MGISKLSKDELLEFNLCASFFELLLESFSVFLAEAFLQGLGSSFNSSLSFSKTETCKLSNSLDNLDLSSSVEGLENYIELCLLFCSSSFTSYGSSNSNCSSRSGKF